VELRAMTTIRTNAMAEPAKQGPVCAPTGGELPTGESQKASIRIEVSRSVGARLRDLLWVLYEESFRAIEDRSLTKQSLDREEFVRLVDHANTFKIIGFDDGEPAGMLVLELVGGLSEPYLRRHYPDQFDRRAIYYGAFAFVALGSRSSRLYYRLVHTAGQLAAVRQGVILLDISRYHERAGVANVVSLVSRSFPDATVEAIDAQVYYAVNLPMPSNKGDAPVADIDLEVTIDMRGPSSEESTRNP
jgi:hypothetical protein